MKEFSFIPPWTLALVAALCAIAIFDLPYGYYQLLRWVVTLSSLAIIVHEDGVRVQILTVFTVVIFPSIDGRGR